MQLLSSFGGGQMVPVNVFFACRLCSLKQNAGCEHPGWLYSNPGGGEALPGWVPARQEETWLLLASESRSALGSRMEEV